MAKKKSTASPIDQAAQAFQSKIISFLQKNPEEPGVLQETLDYLRAVIRGEYSDGTPVLQDAVTRDSIVSIHPPHSVRVQAAKILKEITLDKILPDVKDQGEGKKSASAISDAVKEVAKRKKAEFERQRKEAEVAASRKGQLKKLHEGGR